MTGQIPKYGKYFSREKVPWSEYRSSTKYVLKVDTDWFIQSNKTSKLWTVYYRDIPVATRSTFSLAMNCIIRGIELGFYPCKGRK